MKKLILSLAIIAIGVSSVSAQTKKKEASKDKDFKFSVGLEAALPLGTFGDAYSFGIGGTVQADYTVADKFAITLNTGYIDYLGKTVTIGGVSYKYASYGIVPLLAGAKYHFTEGLYGSAQLGLSFGTGAGGGSNFTYVPGIGYNITKDFDVLLKYVGMSSKGGGSSSSIGLRVAYTFD